MMQFEHWFPTVIGFEMVDFDLEFLTDYAYRLRNESQGRVLSNRDGWQSNDLNHSDPELQEFRTFLFNCINEYPLGNNWQRSHTLGIDNFWININPRGGFNTDHVHPYSIISGVYYVKTPMNSGRIFFQNPCREQLDGFWHTVRMGTPDDPVLNRSIQYQPEAGKIILFPSWIRHWVGQNESDEDRISISFNTKLISH